MARAELLAALGVALLLALAVGAGGAVDMSKHQTDPRHPYYQHLPDCEHRDRPNVFKSTNWTGIVCPMVKDEIGFLSEWTAFYEMQGFNKVIFFDNNSTASFEEVAPWVKTGFVEVVTNWHDDKSLLRNKRKQFADMMYIKFLAETACKERAVREGFDVFMSVDLDEYVFPSSDDATVMDELDAWFTKTTRGVMAIGKYQFNPTPHLLEPVNLLTIEAFQVRTEGRDKMNFYSSVAAKIALRLRGGQDYTNDTVDFIIRCCDFHGCGGGHRGCRPLYDKGEKWKLEGKHKAWLPVLHAHHYARSLEKFASKQRTWTTAGSERNYDIFTFLDRTPGFTFDNSALAWTCQLRELLRNRTGEEHFIRAGDWYRNPEFGRTVEEPLKRGRFGAGYGKVLTPKEMNPYPPGRTYQGAHRAYVPPSAPAGPPK